MHKPLYLARVLAAAALVAAFAAPPRAYADGAVVYAEHMPAVHSYISFCDGTYHDLHYCDFTQPFALRQDAEIDAITMYDLGCEAQDEASMSFLYELADADTDTFQLVAQSAVSRPIACTFGAPDVFDASTTLPFATPAALRADHRYFLLLRSAADEHARAYWGTNAAFGDSFELRGAITPAEPAPIPAHEPVVLVPGMLGSSLVRAADGKEIWPDAGSMLVSPTDDHLNALKLDAQGKELQGQELRTGGILQAATVPILGGSADQSVYRDLVKEFTDRGYVLGKDLFEAPYDWRMDVAGQAARLADIVAAASAAANGGKVVLVGHSMGGLLAKQYLADPAHAALVDKAVLVGVPQLGAPAMFKALAYGDNLGFTFPLTGIDVLDAGKVKEVLANMPGAYELLPSDRYVAVNGGYVKDMRNGESKVLGQAEVPVPNSTLRSAAQQFHASIDDAPIIGPQVYSVMACDDPATIGEVRLYDKNVIDIGSTNGDGTVPLISALRLADNYQNYFISSYDTGIDHMRLVQDGRATGLIRALTEGAAPVLPAGFSTSSAICYPAPGSGSRTFRFSTHSPVTLHVYDAAGRHTGPAAEGTIELGIPGSTYERLGENSFAFVPAGGEYRVEAHGLAAGSFTLKAETLEGSDPVALATYPNVPLAGTSTAAWLQFSDGADQPPLELDQNGDGAADATILPASYRFDGFLPPVLNDGNGIYKLGKVVPLAFQLRNASGTLVSTATASFTLRKVSDAVSGTAKVKKLKRKVRFGSGTEFAYRPKLQEYEYDLSTANLSKGTWELELLLDDGQTYAVTLSFK